MAADPNVGYSYRPGFSSIGVIYNGPNGIPRLLSRVRHTPFHLPHQCNISSIVICSSSDGLVAWYDWDIHIYYIGNPLIPGPDSYLTPLEETPREHDPPFNTNVVLVTDFSILDHPAYHLICAFKDEHHDDLFTFDTYSSLEGHWHSYPGINVPGGTIMPNTGVFCDKFVYWLTMEPCLVVCFDINDIKYEPVAFWVLPVEDDVLDLPDTKLQLGRIQNQVGLVIVDASANNRSVNLYLIKGNGWVLSAKLNLLIVQSLFVGQLEDCLICTSWPYPLRFQSSKMEVFMYMSGRVVLWEKDSNNPARMRAVLLQESVMCHIEDGTSHVGTSLLPGNFHLMPNRGIHQRDNDGRESVGSCQLPSSSESF